VEGGCVGYLLSVPVPGGWDAPFACRRRQRINGIQVTAFSCTDIIGPTSTPLYRSNISSFVSSLRCLMRELQIIAVVTLLVYHVKLTRRCWSAPKLTAHHYASRSLLDVAPQATTKRCQFCWIYILHNIYLVLLYIYRVVQNCIECSKKQLPKISIYI